MLVQKLFKSTFRFAELALGEKTLKQPTFLKMVEGYFNKAAIVVGLE